MHTARSTPSAVEPSAHTRGWVANALLHGRDALWIKDALAAWGVPHDVAAAAVDDAAACPYVKAAQIHLKRARKMDALLEVYTRMWRRSAEAGGVLEVDALGESEFAQRFYHRNRPVIVRGGAAHWPAVAGWTPQAFKDRFGDVEIEYMQGSNRYRGRQGAPCRTTMADFVERVEATRAGNDFYLTATNMSLRRCAGLLPLMDDLRPLAFLPNLDLHDPDVVNLWFGPRGTVTPLHHDVVSVVFVQVYGCKQVILAPSFALPLVYNRYGVYSDVDPIVSDPKRFPRAASVPWLTVDLAPGDVLFIPVGWWHWMFALQCSISVSLTSFEVAGAVDRLESYHGLLEPPLDAAPPVSKAVLAPFDVEMP